MQSVHLPSAAHAAAFPMQYGHWQPGPGAGPRPASAADGSYPPAAGQYAWGPGAHAYAHQPGQGMELQDFRIYPNVPPPAPARASGPVAGSWPALAAAPANADPYRKAPMQDPLHPANMSARPQKDAPAAMSRGQEGAMGGSVALSAAEREQRDIAAAIAASLRPENM
jgi:hypothetical protein